MGNSFSSCCKKVCCSDCCDTDSESTGCCCYKRADAGEDPVIELPLLRSPLKISSVSFHPKENAKEHHTSRFDLVEKGTPVLRRGQAFLMTLSYKSADDRKFDLKHDKVKLIFSFGRSPDQYVGTKQIIQVGKDFRGKNSKWEARVDDNSKANSVTLKVQSSSDSCVGIWNCLLETSLTSNDNATETFHFSKQIYLLFNPWNKNDATFMREKDLLNEYVLEDTGKVWVGAYNNNGGRHWAFGQFHEDVLPLLVVLLEKTRLDYSTRNNPILFSRAISKMVNANDDRGVLLGKWDGEYSDGTSPSAWTGSVPIIKKYFENLQPVKYGQCWVFAAVVCTFCRAIGIPCRVVSNFVSAHDTNGSLTIDNFYDKDNNKVDGPNGWRNDSIWNFHVWNDVFFARPDLAKGYGGWQAIDATPQEKSGGVFQCGPASLEAVKRGQASFPYDTSFLISEVNADVVSWREDKSTEFGFVRMSTEKYHVGKELLTKKPNVFDPNGEADRMDVIQEYKLAEGTVGERLMLGNAGVDSSTKRDVEFKLKELEKIPVGDPFQLIIEVKNKSAAERTINADLSVISMFYNGVKAKEIKREMKTITLKPSEKAKLIMTILPSAYLDKLVEYGIMKIRGICAVAETKQVWCEEDDFQVVKPSLKIECEQKIVAGKPTNVTFSFKNPIGKRLTNCVINLEGPFLSGFANVNLKDIDAGEELNFSHKFIPQKSGRQNLIAVFSSRELVDIFGSSVLEIA